MANLQLKVNQLAKDMGIKSKDISDALAECGIEVKTTQSTLSGEQFAILMEKLTRSHQITHIEDYIEGVTYIPSKVKAEKKSEADTDAGKQEASQTPETVTVTTEPLAEVKAEPKPEVKTEPKPQVKAEPKAEVKAEPKAEVKAEPKPEVKPEPKAEVRAENKTDFRSETATAPKRFDARDARTGSDRGFGGDRNDRFDRRSGNDRFDRRDQRSADNGNGGRRDQRPDGNRFSNNGQGAQQRPDRRDDRRDNRGGGKDGDFGGKEYTQNAPRERFQPQAIVRGQTPKGTDSSKVKVGTRVVDTRSSTVDLSKYDEKLDSYVPESVKEDRGGTQKVKSKQTQAKKNGEGTPSSKFSPDPRQKQNQKPGKNKFKGQKSAPTPVVKQQLNITIPDEISVGELAIRLKVNAGEIIKKLMLMGQMVTKNEVVDFDTASLIAMDYDANITKEVQVTIEEKLFENLEDTEDTLVERAPVVCVMGHVDHGKTSLLDAIRNTHVTRGEAGGITQHIGAYRVSINGKDITFLDTPGHEAFTAMRARGAQATDIAILVVAADDGIMPQTVEAINHAKAAGVEIIVAINKIDKPTAKPDSVMQELIKYELVPEAWGGDVICVPVSAHTGEGIDTLLENVLIVAELKEFKANPNRYAKGIVIEAKLDKGRGPVATVLVQNGTLHSGDVVIAGTAVGRVRAMTDHTGRTVKAAAPSVPVEIIGLSEVPVSGDEFNAVADEKMARELAEKRRNQAKEDVFKANARANLDALFAQISEGIKDLNVIVKADVVGSAEAVRASLVKLSNEEVKVNVIHSAVGGITENDVMLAATSNAIIVGFNVRPDRVAIESAERQGVDIRTYRVIYDCIEEITAAMKGMLAPKFKEVVLGHAEVRQTIHVPNVGTIAGSYILSGKITRSSLVRVLRDSVVIFEDKISSLRRFKDDVKEVAQSFECGIGLERFNDIKVGDILEAYVMEQIRD